MTDRELLELAAKAAGLELWTHADGGFYLPDPMRNWNPLTDDGDALRLAVTLNLAVQTLPGRDKPASEAWHNDKYARERWCDNYNDPFVATRRAIVRAAAAIEQGK